MHLHGKTCARVTAFCLFGNINEGLVCKFVVRTGTNANFCFHGRETLSKHATEILLNVTQPRVICYWELFACPIEAKNAYHCHDERL